MRVRGVFVGGWIFGGYTEIAELAEVRGVVLGVGWVRGEVGGGEGGIGVVGLHRAAACGPFELAFGPRPRSGGANTVMEVFDMQVVTV